MAAPIVTENTYALTTVRKLKASMRQTSLTAEDDAFLIDLVNGVSNACERYCKRNFRSRTYTHNTTIGSDMPPLKGDGRLLFLRNMPVTSISSLKINPSVGALTEGWDQDYTILHDEGIVELHPNSGLKFSGRREVECTYVGGYLDHDEGDATTRALWGYIEVASDLENSVILQVKEIFDATRQNRLALASLTTEGGTFQIQEQDILPKVRRVWNSYAVRRIR